jgi:UDP-N-acetylglucosamine acyltransferase
MPIHPTASVHPRAKLARDVQVGAYTVIDEHVEVGAGTWIGPRVVITGHTRLGRDNRVHPMASIGTPPQDMKYRDEPTRLDIGDGNTIWECCTLNVATTRGTGVTRIGDHNWFLPYSHVAHDCEIGNQITLGNGVQLGGHVAISDHATLGNGTLVHQFSRIGEYASTNSGAAVQRDVPPYVTCGGNFAQPHGLNREGLERCGASPAEMEALERAYDTLYRSGLAFVDAKAALAEQGKSAPRVRTLAEFVASTVRGIIR